MRKIGRAMISVLEFIISMLLVTMVASGLVGLTLRGKIKKMLHQSNEDVFNKYFKKSGIFDRNMKSSLEIAKFYVSPKMWCDVTENDIVSLLTINRKIEITYYSSFIGVMALFFLTLILMALQTD